MKKVCTIALLDILHIIRWRYFLYWYVYGLFMTTRLLALYRVQIADLPLPTRMTNIIGNKRTGYNSTRKRKGGKQVCPDWVYCTINLSFSLESRENSNRVRQTSINSPLHLCRILSVCFSPIHMSVLLRKPDLVHRYSCVLQVLESSVDLVNDDKMVRHQKYPAPENVRNPFIHARARQSLRGTQWRFLSPLAFETS